MQQSWHGCHLHVADYQSPKWLSEDRDLGWDVKSSIAGLAVAPTPCIQPCKFVRLSWPNDISQIVAGVSDFKVILHESGSIPVMSEAPLSNPT